MLHELPNAEQGLSDDTALPVIEFSDLSASARVAGALVCGLSQQKLECIGLPQLDRAGSDRQCKSPPLSLSEGQ